MAREDRPCGLGTATVGTMVAAGQRGGSVGDRDDGRETSSTGWARRRLDCSLMARREEAAQQVRHGKGRIWRRNRAQAPPCFPDHATIPAPKLLPVASLHHRSSLTCALHFCHRFPPWCPAQITTQPVPLFFLIEIPRNKVDQVW
ncbi:hypothetical protein M0R45_000856 [Rubus argutus]|uniref:Uncharacterized protein n=1 Tax=Rubus argutus TaxID=59490 RepID=A0AAW1VN85_RUBAR